MGHSERLILVHRKYFSISFTSTRVTSFWLSTRQDLVRSKEGGVGFEVENYQKPQILHLLGLFTEAQPITFISNRTIRVGTSFTVLYLRISSSKSNRPPSPSEFVLADWVEPQLNYRGHGHGYNQVKRGQPKGQCYSYNVMGFFDFCILSKSLFRTSPTQCNTALE
jgi:hypothetical protein